MHQDMNERKRARDEQNERKKLRKLKLIKITSDRINKTSAMKLAKIANNIIKLHRNRI